jgi:hypothetical protein
MSVHTLTVTDDGMVQIGAHITRDEARAAGPQILKFCCDMADVPMPLLIPRAPVRPGQDAITENFGGLGVRRGQVVVEMICRSCSEDMMIRLSPEAAEEAASLLATYADLARGGVDPKDLESLSAFLDEEMDTDPEELARRLLRHFNVTERAL